MRQESPLKMPRVPGEMADDDNARTGGVDDSNDKLGI